MKKIILSLSVALLSAAALSSCGDKASAPEGQEPLTAEDKAFADTLSKTLGEFAGAQQAMMYKRMQDRMTPEELKNFSKEDFLRGVRVILEADTSKVAFYQGVQTGLQLVQPIIGVNQSYGYPVSPKAVYKAFKEVYMKDSVNPEEYYNAYQQSFETLQARARERELKRIEASEENKTNLAAGQAYADKMVKEGYTKDPSGIVYKIDEPGTGEPVKPTDKVAIYYKGMKIDGQIFDQTRLDAEGNRTPYTSSASAFIPGFNKALTLLAKGGKMTVVIPGSQAYGLEGAGEQIGPNETLVFEIEIADINPPAPAPATGTPQRALPADRTVRIQ